MKLFSDISNVLPNNTPPFRALVYRSRHTTKRMVALGGGKYGIVPSWESSWALHIPLPWKRTEAGAYEGATFRGWAALKIATFQCGDGRPRRWMLGLCVPRPDPSAYGRWETPGRATTDLSAGMKEAARFRK